MKSWRSILTAAINYGTRTYPLGGKDIYILGEQKKFAVPLTDYKFGVYNFDTREPTF